MPISEKKILIFSTAYLPLTGGAEMAIKEITDRLPDCQFDLICARLNRKLPRQERVGYINVYRVGWGHNFDKTILPLAGFLKAVLLTTRNRYQLIWAMMASQGGLTAAIFKLFCPRVPYLLTLQEGDSLEYIKTKMKPIWLFRLIFTKADFIQAISNFLAQWGREMGAGCPIEVVPNGAVVPKLKIENEKIKIIKSELNIGSDEKVIITISRLVIKNGVADLIAAMRHLKTPAKLIIIGDGTERQNLELQVTNYKLQDKIAFLGALPNKEALKYLSIADVFVRPSLSEGLGNVFLEAMAHGVPVIGTPVGGIPDFLTDGKTGLFCAVQNPQSIAEKTEILFADQKLQEKLIANGRKLVEEKYNWDTIAEKMGQVFGQMSS